MDRLSFPCEVKLSGDPLRGELDGYASVFGGLDSYGDQVAPGAFSRTLAEHKARGTMPAMYFQHGMGDPRPVGVWNAIEEDGRGLKIGGRLIGLDTEQGKYNLALVRDGAMRGLSIGYRAMKADYPKKPGQPRRILREIKLLEVSVVDQPADNAARVLGLKSALDEFDAQDWRELEAYIREEYKLSRNDAVKAISGFKSWLRRDAEDVPAPRDEVDAEKLANLIRRNIATLS